MELKRLSKNLLKELDLVKLNTPKITEQARISISLCRQLLSILRNKITTKKFVDIVEEIEFFKETKHVPLTQLIYFKEIYRFEIHIPKSDGRVQEKYILKELNQFNHFFLNNIDFGQYIELKCTHLDSYYFTRKNNHELPISVSPLYLEDPEFNTPKDMLLAQFKAYGLMVLYLKTKLSYLRNGTRKVVSKKTHNLKCIASKTDIVELIYALIASGAIRGDIKELANAFELILNTDLGDFYRTFIEIRARNIDPTKFLDSLKAALLRRIQEADN